MHKSIFIKRTAKILISAIGILLIVGICTALVHYNKLIDINNYNDVATAICENSLVDSTDHFEIRTEDDYTAVFYNSGVCSSSIAVLERDYIFPYRYKILGSNIKSGEISKFSYTEKTRRKSNEKIYFWFIGNHYCYNICFGINSICC